jgi:hypothetical protein
MRQVAGAFAEYEKGRLVAKLRSGRERKRRRPARRWAGGSRTQSCAQRSLRRPSGYGGQAPKPDSVLASERSATGWRMPALNERGQLFNAQSVRAIS